MSPTTTPNPAPTAALAPTPTFYSKLVDHLRIATTVAVDIIADEEPNLIKHLEQEVASKPPLSMRTFCWTVAKGMQQVGRANQHNLTFTDVKNNEREQAALRNPVAALNFVETYGASEGEGAALFILCDLHKYVKPTVPEVERALKDLITRTIVFSNKRVLLLGQDINLPPDFETLVTHLPVPLPSGEEMLEFVDRRIQEILNVVSTLVTKNPVASNLGAEEMQAIARAMQGLTKATASKLIKNYIFARGSIDRGLIEAVTQHKQEKLRKLGVEFSEAPSTAVGGLDLLQAWLERRSQLLGESARQQGLPMPKGIVLVGPPGSGKSMICRAVGHRWGVPVFKFDAGSMFSSALGESEARLRRVLQMVEACAPAVLWIDEIDKAFASSSGGISTDSGASQRMFGYMLTWMSERKAPVFIVASANGVDHLPPEFLRKGRWDEVFYVSLPNKDERRRILEIHLSRYGATGISELDLEQLARMTTRFSGAELAQAVDEAAIEAFNSGRGPSALTIEDLRHAIDPDAFIPLARMQEDKINRLEIWARERARPASSPEQGPAFVHPEMQ